MTTDRDEPRFALFVLSKPEVTNDAMWKSCEDALQAIAKPSAPIEHLGRSAKLLPLPDTLPTLCQFVAIAQQYTQKYTVRLFGQPLLSYPSPEPPPQDV